MRGAPAPACAPSIPLLWGADASGGTRGDASPACSCRHQLRSGDAGAEPTPSAAAPGGGGGDGGAVRAGHCRCPPHSLSGSAPCPGAGGGMAARSRSSSIEVSRAMLVSAGEG